ncbi:MAG TPA: glycosyltransferase [Flavobacterium sp.]|nr:glycosyltransferase [Flavobacterium sp.]
MRIVQVIDSLETGGAERIAVNYANALSRNIEFSGLVATRAEGSLKAQIDTSVDYVFLKKTRTVDFKAAFRLRDYCKTNRIDYIHAHSTSYFLGLMVRMLYPKVKLIWHDHNGMSEYLETTKAVPVNIASIFFKGIIVVNNQLKIWAERKLHCNHVIYIPNFTEEEKNIKTETILKGTAGKQILSLANLREQKNHFFLLDVATMMKKSHPDWTFHLVGKDFQDDYSREIRDLVVNMKLEETVFIYGSRNDIAAIISQAEIAILTSKSEGLPVALLEYGLYKKPVVITSVGEVPLIIQDAKNGYIVPNDRQELFYDALVGLIENEDLRHSFGAEIYKTIAENYSEEAAIGRYLEWIETLKNA